MVVKLESVKSLRFVISIGLVIVLFRQFSKFFLVLFIVLVIVVVFKGLSTVLLLIVMDYDVLLSVVVMVMLVNVMFLMRLMEVFVVVDSEVDIMLFLCVN